MRLILVSLVGLLTAGNVFAQGTAVTFNKEVLPILQKNCQTCHRQGQVAPMSLETYESARPWARAIKAALLSKKMPPWFAEGDHFSNQRPKITAAEVATLVSWVDSGAIEGDPKDKPAPLAWNPSGWTIRPDIVIEMPIAYQVPATGVIPWLDFKVPYKIEEDLWIAAGEILPSAVQVTHHIDIDVAPPSADSKWLDTWDVTQPLPEGSFRGGLLPGRFIGINWVPGANPQRFDMHDSCMFIPKGSTLLFQVHYNTNGKAAQDRSRAALERCDGVPKNKVALVQESGGEGETGNGSLLIPAGHPNYPAHREIVLAKDAWLGYVIPHMHVRGKDFKYTVTYPDGRSEMLLYVPRYNYNWQIVYFPNTPLLLPAGTKLSMDGHWDNSAANPFNPDPTVDVKWGLQAWEEMFGGTVYLIMPKDADPRTIVRRDRTNVVTVGSN